ncbi:MAG: hypothetical protein GY861_14030 [bacterium]|nr:hypothetical protein [bacterium]
MKDYEYIKEARDKVICRFTLIDPIEKKAQGTMYFNGEVFEIISGPYGRGYAPRGNYKAYSDQLKHSDKKAYSQHDFGWYLPIGPQFETYRTGLMIHPDGNVKGSLGCIAINFLDLNENVKCYNLFRDYFEKNGILNVEIV